MAAKTWDEAGDDPTITTRHVAPAITASISQLREQLYESRYRQMPEGIRDYVHAAAALQAKHGTIKSNAVAERLGLTTQQASTRRDEIISTYQVLASPRRNELEFTTPGFAEWRRQQHAVPARTVIDADDTIEQLLEPHLEPDTLGDGGPDLSI